MVQISSEARNLNHFPLFFARAKRVRIGICRYYVIIRKYLKAIKINSPNILLFLALLFFTLDLGYFVERKNFTHLIFDYTILFILYFIILRKTSNKKEATPFWLFSAVILRGCLIFSVPNLSEDIYRFIWDGRLIHLGINPFDHKPIYYIDNQLFTDVLTPDLYAALNSKNYYTVYPPICQGVFATAIWLFPKSIYGAMVSIKSFLWLCEVGSLFLMYKMLNSPVVLNPSNTNNSVVSNSFDTNTSLLCRINSTLQENRVLIYALNPLIIIELCGNAHFEAAMIFFFIGALYLLQKANSEIKKNALPYSTLVLSAVAFALSIASKILPLMLSIAWVRLIGWRKSCVYGGVVIMSLILLFAPLYNALFIQNISNSLGLYFQKFEFNASLYYIYSHIEKARLGYNPITQISRDLNILIILSILYITFFEKKQEQPLVASSKIMQVLNNYLQKIKHYLKKNRETGLTLSDTPISFASFWEKCLGIITVYFLCAAVVHPWYLAFPLALSIFTRYNYTVLWSFLIPFTYIHYAYPQPTENFWIIGVEYLMVISYALFEVKKYSHS